MIVNLLRGDLRLEIIMADEAFALSPINASAALPTDNDYDAICDAFMETSRGRWFLREYTKRNRNADTQMVLEAVARIEDNLARQKFEEAAGSPVAEPPVDIFPAIQAAMLDTRGQIEQSFAQDDNKLALDLIKGGMDTIRSVAWALRERGVDLQICGIFDHQVNLMMDGYLRLVASQASASAAPEQVLAAFDGLLQRISHITSPGTEPVGDELAKSEPAESEKIVVLQDGIQAAPVYDAPADGLLKTAPDADSAFRKIYGNGHDIEIVDSPVDDSVIETLLLDDSEDDDFIQAIADTAQELARLEPLDTGLAPVPAVAPDMPAQMDAVILTESRPAPAREPALVRAASAQPMPAQTMISTSLPETPVATPEPEPNELPSGTSLGHALLRSGIIRADGPRPNPMAAFGRMSQAEKIAFTT